MDCLDIVIIYVYSIILNIRGVKLQLSTNLFLLLIILSRTRCLNLLQGVKVIIIINKIKSHPVFAGQVAFHYKMHVQTYNNTFLHMDYISPYEHMYKRCAFYTSFLQLPVRGTPSEQGCIKSCIKQKSQPYENPYARRVLFFDVYRKEVLC